jgi:hypothetical protein
MSMSENIFVNYRRQSDSGMAGRIYDSLSLSLPGASIFMDVDKLNPGDDFEMALERSLAGCKVLLAIMGPQWATIIDPNGQRRLDDPSDFVRKEISVALGKGVRVIPVLIGGAQMPEARSLPDDLKALVRRQAIEIRHEHFKADVDALAQAIAAATPSARGRRRRLAAILGATALVVVATAGLLYVKSGPSRPSASPFKGDGPTWTEWMDQEAYQREFDRQLKNKWYPRMIEAQLQQGVVKYHASYEPFSSSTFDFYSRHSINDDEFAKFDADMTAAGYTRVFQQRIVIGSRAFNQATWTKR